MLTSALALAGIAVANILLPMLVKQHFPHRTGLVTGAYTMALTAGTTVAAASAVPVAHAFGSWRAGLGVWAGLAAVAVLPWVPLALRARAARRAATPAVAAAAPARVRPARTRLGWAMAVYFGAQSLSGYAIMGWLAQLFRDAGYRAGDGRAAARRGDRARRAGRAADADPGRPAADAAPAGAGAHRRARRWPTSGWRSRRTAARCSGCCCSRSARARSR